MYVVAQPLTEAINNAKQIHFLAVPFRIVLPLERAGGDHTVAAEQIEGMSGQGLGPSNSTL